MTTMIIMFSLTHLSRNSTWLVTSRHDTTRTTCRAVLSDKHDTSRRVSSLLVTTFPCAKMHGLGSVSYRYVTWSVKWNLSFTLAAQFYSSAQSSAPERHNSVEKDILQHTVTHTHTHTHTHIRSSAMSDVLLICQRRAILPSRPVAFAVPGQDISLASGFRSNYPSPSHWDLVCHFAP